MEKSIWIKVHSLYQDLCIKGKWYQNVFIFLNLMKNTKERMHCHCGTNNKAPAVDIHGPL